MPMPIKACGGAEFFRGACRDRYLGRRDCADCEPLARPEPQGDGKTISVASEPSAEPAAAPEATSGDEPAGDVVDDVDEPATPRAPRGAKKRP